VPVVSISQAENCVYVILGIDENANDQVIAVAETFEDAKRYLCRYLSETPFYDLWIEKHSLL